MSSYLTGSVLRTHRVVESPWVTGDFFVHAKTARHGMGFWSEASLRVYLGSAFGWTKIRVVWGNKRCTVKVLLVFVSMSWLEVLVFMLFEHLWLPGFCFLVFAGVLCMVVVVCLAAFFNPSHVVHEVAKPKHVRVCTLYDQCFSEGTSTVPTLFRMLFWSATCECSHWDGSTFSGMRSGNLTGKGLFL